jgi:hypothetical protein
MLNVYFTVDTESSMGGAWQHPDRRPVKADRHVFCRIRGRDYGIGLITDILGERGFRGTFFVETLATLVNGDADTGSIFDHLLGHEQDVQLHIHPVFRLYQAALLARGEGRPGPVPNATTDFIGAYEENRQLELLQEASALFRRFTGRPPVAFRAGCFGAGRETLRCLRRLGIFLDTSFSPCHPAWSFSGEELQPNSISKIEGIWEVPVTVARTPLPEGNGFKFADPCSLSFTELRTMLEAAAACGQEHFVILFHCFSAVKPRNGTYAEMRPDRITIRRLRKLIRHLSANSHVYRVRTFGELAGDLESLREVPGRLPSLGLLPACIRKSVQVLNRFHWV